ncbi:MAG: ceramidase domain-containing protein [Candidatus Phosphoribacter sp.]
MLPARRTARQPSRPGVLSPTGRTRLALVTLTCAVALLVSIAAVIAWLAPTAFGDRPATCVETRCFCEAVGSGLLRQPANALSSLAFCVSAVWAAMRGRRLPPRSPELRLTPALVCTLVALGAGSLAYHGQLTFAGQLLDIQGMYVLGTLLVVGALWRRGTIDAKRASASAAVVLVTLAGLQWLLPDARRWLFAIVLIPGIVLERSLAPRSAPLRAAVLTLLLGYAAWLVDDRGWWCDPQSWAQGHALWHLLTALSAGLVVEHYGRTAHSAGRWSAPCPPDDRTPPAW